MHPYFVFAYGSLEAMIHGASTPGHSGEPTARAAQQRRRGVAAITRGVGLGDGTGASIAGRHVDWLAGRARTWLEAV
jgi:hypothetical protein